MFARLYGVALVAHVVGNWAQPDIPTLVGFLNLSVGVAGLTLAVWPRRPFLLAASILTLGSVLGEMPFTGNHWLVAALAGLAILVTGANPDSYLPALRWIFVVFYGFAAFAKLNSGFFDSSVSCAVFYTNQSLHGFGLDPLPESSFVRTLTIWATAGIELSIVPLLLIRRTRYAGAVLATAFHILISFDLNQHFYDFTSILIALLVCFLPKESLSDLCSRLTPWIRPLRLGWLVLGPFLLLLAVLPVSDATVAVLTRFPFVVWIPASLAWLWGIVRAWRSGTELRWHPGWLAGAVVVATLINGLTPYTEIKTAYGFNMYANLVTARGESNHFLVRHT
ncbi:MAG TPA: HTTM domain-containing protein, partial [Acidimicrobiia bacterium]|nr:HTTM domain-containing protein [Acidimicrobiia bacterium]